jgi:hypothetical protein
MCVRVRGMMCARCVHLIVLNSDEAAAARSMIRLVHAFKGPGRGDERSVAHLLQSPAALFEEFRIDDGRPLALKGLFNSIKKKHSVESFTHVEGLAEGVEPGHWFLEFSLFLRLPYFGGKPLLKC